MYKFSSNNFTGQHNSAVKIWYISILKIWKCADAAFDFILRKYNRGLVLLIEGNSQPYHKLFSFLVISGTSFSNVFNEVQGFLCNFFPGIYFVFCDFLDTNFLIFYAFQDFLVISSCILL